MEDNYSDLERYFKTRLNEFKDIPLSDENIIEFFTGRANKYMQRFELVSSAQGKIEEILLFIDEDLYGYSIEIDTNPNFSKIRAHAFFKGVTRTKYTNLERLNGGSLLIEKGGWVQDHFLVMRDVSLNRLLLLEPLFPIKNVLYSQILAGSLRLKGFDPETIIIPFPIHGGNILIEDKFVFLGDSVITDLCALFESDIFYELKNKILKYQISKKKINSTTVLWGTIKEIVAKFLIPNGDKELILIEQGYLHGAMNQHFYKNEDQKLIHPYEFRYHIDLFITLGGKKDNEYIIFVGKPTKPIDEKSKELDEFFDKANTWFCSFKNEMEKMDGSKLGFKFKVYQIENPCFTIKTNWHFFSYNNCLVESYNNHRKLFLPQYSYPEDEKAHEILSFYNTESRKMMSKKEFKIQLIQLKEFTHMMKKYGASIHCLIKTLLRTKN